MAIVICTMLHNYKGGLLVFQPKDHCIRELLTNFKASDGFTPRLITEKDEPEGVEDPCEMTLQVSYTSLVHYTTLH